MRPMWTGVLVVSALRIPVQILGAGEGQKVTFNHGHRCAPARITRVQQKRWCPTCKRELSHHAPVRVYEHTPGQYLEISDADLATCEAQTSDELTVVGVASSPHVSMLHIETTAYLVPASQASAELLATFCAALGPGRIAIARFVFQKREQIVWLGVSGQCCVVYLLRTVEHVTSILRTDGPHHIGTRHDDVAKLRQVLNGLSSRSRIDHIIPRDGYQQRVRALLEQRLAAATRRTLAVVKPRRRRA